MSKEPDAVEKPVEKLLMDRPSDFKFQAAYNVYSNVWDRNPTRDVRVKLNAIMTSLSSNEIDYPTFYREISEYRGELSPGYGRGERIQTQRKSEFRRKEERRARNKRHRR
jgi:hypothetical protein